MAASISSMSVTLDYSSLRVDKATILSSQSTTMRLYEDRKALADLLIRATSEWRLSALFAASTKW